MFLDMDVSEATEKSEILCKRLFGVKCASSIHVLPTGWQSLPLLWRQIIDDILTTSLIVPLLFLPLFPSPTSPLLCLPFLLAIFFSVFAFSFFFYFVVVFVLFRLPLFVLSSSVAGQICQPFQCSG